MYIKQDYDDGFEHLMLDLKEKYPKAIFELSGISVEDLDHTKFAKKYFSKKNVADASVDANANVQIKNIATFMVERHKGSDKLDSLFLFWKTAKKLFSEREANILIEKEINKDLNVQDCGNFFLPYCIAFDTYDLLLKGLPFVTNYPSAPAKHSDVFWQHTVQLLQSAAPQMMGATAIPNFIVIYSALLKYDSLNEEYPIPNYNTHKKLFERYVTQRFQELVFTLNQPLRQVQSTFSNITIFDSFFMKELCSKYIVNDTLIDSDFAMYIQKLFLLTVKELNKKQIGTFPILTAQFKKDENGEVEDTEFLDLIAEVNLDSAHLNIYSDVSLTSLSSCCFDGEQKILVKSSTKGVFLTSFEDFKNLPYTGNKENLKIAHNGNWVTGKFLEIPRSNKLMYKITTVNNKELLVTSDHKHLTTEGDKITSNLTESDYLVFSNRPFSAIPENNQNLTYEQGVLIGAYLGDGSRRKLKDVNSASVYFSLNKDKYEKLLTLFKKALNDFGVDSHICLATPYNNVYPVQITSLKLFDILNYWVSGNYCYTKEINLNCLTQNEEFRKGIIDGIYLTDGGNSNRIYTTSKNLVNQLEVIMMSLGYVSIINESDRTDEPVIIRDQEFNRNYVLYCIRYYTPNTKRTQKNIYKVINNSVAFKIKSIEVIKDYSKENVFCFEMDNKEEPYFTLPNGIITHNCRLINNVEDLINATQNEYMNLIGGASIKVGSFGVTTLPLVRIALKAKKNEELFFKLLEEEAQNCYKINHCRRYLISEKIEQGQMPLYTEGFIDLKNQYSTMGINGFYECLLYMGYDITKSEGIEFGIKILKVLDTVSKDKLKKYGYRTNIEQIPAEQTSSKLAKADKILYSQNDFYIYGNQFIPLTIEEGLYKRIEIQADLEKYFSGGTILHVNVNEKIPTKSLMKKIIKFVIKSGVKYFAINYIMNLCENKHYTVGDYSLCPDCQGKIVDHVTRIVGFPVPVSAWSSERQKEFYDRKKYKIEDLNM